MAVVDGNIREHLIDTFTQLSKLINITPDVLVDVLLEGLPRPPDWSTVRLNTMKYANDYLITNISSTINETYASRDAAPPNISLHDKMDDVLCIANVDRTGSHFVSHDSHVIVDVLCGCAVLRGADVFAPGVMGAPRGIAKGDEVSVYADIDGKCLKGLATPYTGRVALVGNGVVVQDRTSWFGQQPIRGVAIKMTNPLYVSPRLSCDTDLYYPQNLPSSLVSHVLDPTPGDLVLDMCAAPGGKTTHIASLMRNKGCVVAIDRNASKVAKLSQAIQLFSHSCVRCFAYDSTKLVKEDAPVGVATETPPPYAPKSFDKILLDGPCSGLGQRPLLKYNLKLAELLSYQQYQRQLVKQAVMLLKPGGTLVYSTCTVAPQENEQQVAWILERFPCMQLVKQVPSIGYPGLPLFGLDEDQCGKLQRFGPKQFYSLIFKDFVNTDSIACDTIGFFIAKFVKK